MIINKGSLVADEVVLACRMRLEDIDKDMESRASEYSYQGKFKELKVYLEVSLNKKEVLQTVIQELSEPFCMDDIPF